MATAILVDGGFFIKRYRAIYRDPEDRRPEQVARNMHQMLIKHLCDRNGRQLRELYRIHFYDCPPIHGRFENPVTGEIVDFADTDEAVFRRALHDKLKTLRKVALRFGHMGGSYDWIIRPELTQDVIDGRLPVADMEADDVRLDLRQKGLEMRIGLDIAALAFKRLADQIVLVAGDRDFIPAAKLARREGIDLILDPMWSSIDPALHEHIDGLQSPWPNPRFQQRREGNSSRDDRHERGGHDHDDHDDQH